MAGPRSISMSELAKIAADASARARDEARQAGLLVPVWDDGLVAQVAPTAGEPGPSAAAVPTDLPSAADEILSNKGIEVRAMKHG